MISFGEEVDALFQDGSHHQQGEDPRCSNSNYRGGLAVGNDDDEDEEERLARAQREKEQEDEARAREQEESELAEMPLPELPKCVAPATVEGVPTDDVYDVIQSLRRLIDDPTKEQSIRQNLLQEPQMAKAIVQVLHESRMLVKLFGSSEEEAVGGRAHGISAAASASGSAPEMAALPAGGTPSLPSGVHSWITKKPAAHQQQQQQQAGQLMSSHPQSQQPPQYYPQQQQQQKRSHNGVFYGDSASAAAAAPSFFTPTTTTSYASSEQQQQPYGSLRNPTDSRSNYYYYHHGGGDVLAGGDATQCATGAYYSAAYQESRGGRGVQNGSGIHSYRGGSVGGGREQQYSGTEAAPTTSVTAAAPLPHFISTPSSGEGGRYPQPPSTAPRDGGGGVGSTTRGGGRKGSRGGGSGGGPPAQTSFEAPASTLPVGGRFLMPPTSNTTNRT